MRRRAFWQTCPGFASVGGGALDRFKWTLPLSLAGRMVWEKPQRILLLVSTLTLVATLALLARRVVPATQLPLACASPPSSAPQSPAQWSPWGADLAGPIPRLGVPSRSAVAAAITALVVRQLAPFSHLGGFHLGGLDGLWMADPFKSARFQIANHSLYVDPAQWPPMFRMHAFLRWPRAAGMGDILLRLLAQDNARRAREVSAEAVGRSASEPDVRDVPDVDVMLDVGDEASLRVSVRAAFPRFSSVHCPDAYYEPSWPYFLKGFGGRDLDELDGTCLARLTQRTDGDGRKAVGVLRANWAWNESPRAGLAELGRVAPDHLDCVPDRHQPLQEQQAKFRYVVYAGGPFHGSDRLKWLLCTDMVVFKHDTPCDEWYGLLLRPWEHYVPYTLETLVARIDWARAHPTECAQIVRNANDFARAYVTVDAHLLYARILLQHYHALQRWTTAPTNGSVRVADFAALDAARPPF